VAGAYRRGVRRLPAGDDFDGWVELLGVDRRRPLARLHLLGAGAVAVPAIRRGLRSDDADVRRLCVNLLDKLLDDDAVLDLVAALDDDDPEVVGRAMHALACDACKQGECRPGDDLFVPRAIELLADANPDVRAGAIDALGKAAERGNAAAIAALASSAVHDRDAGLRGMARGRSLKASR
jgi:HEAT repeat protein